MTDLEGFARKAGQIARRVFDDDKSTGRDPVWAAPEDAWHEFSNAVLRAPNDLLKQKFLEGWGQ